MKLLNRIFSSIALCTLLINCNNSSENDKISFAKAIISKKDWGEVGGKKVYLFTLENNKGTIVTISNYGGTVTSFVMPDKNGNKSSIIVGFDSLQPYLQQPPY